MAERKSDSILPTLDDLFSIQESQILPSEKVFAYKMRLGAMKRQGQRTDLIYLLIEKGACHSLALFYSIPFNPFVTECHPFPTAHFTIIRFQYMIKPSGGNANEKNKIVFIFKRQYNIKKK
ncbi:hypothetical protein [Catenibacterium mitsuokai]|uniref:hypothetical protein n=1 Tax=Catenibacterium mitsuokai TaxID=100886 RepID=UPI003F8B7E5F